MKWFFWTSFFRWAAGDDRENNESRSPFDYLVYFIVIVVLLLAFM